jgi:hypothetical protein
VTGAAARDTTRYKYQVTNGCAHLDKEKETRPPLHIDECWSELNKYFLFANFYFLFNHAWVS